MNLVNNFFQKVSRKKESIFPRNYLAPPMREFISKEVVFEDNADRDIFFGYHDRTPFNTNSRFVLSHRSNKEKLDIGFFNMDDELPDFNFISSSEAFSRQQGTMLQWDYLHNTSSVNFNTCINGAYKNISIDTNNQSIISEINFPVYCISSDFKWALSCNFFQLAKQRPGYGIENSQVITKKDKHLDGIWIINRLTGDTQLLASYRDMLKDLPCDFSDNIYVNHLSFSPDTNTVAWFLINEKKPTRKIYFLSMCLDQKREIKNIESDRLISHYCWVNNDVILGINRDLDLNWNYSEYNLGNSSRIDLKINTGFDGHPMFNRHSNKIIIDSTPDSKRYQHLLCYDWASKKMIQLDKLFTPKNFLGPDRCDLHPRWSPDSLMVSVDTPIRNKRCQKITILNKDILQPL